MCTQVRAQSNAVNRCVGFAYPLLLSLTLWLHLLLRWHQRTADVHETSLRLIGRGVSCTLPNARLPSNHSFYPCCCIACFVHSGSCLSRSLSHHDQLAWHVPRKRVSHFDACRTFNYYQLALLVSVLYRTKPAAVLLHVLD